MANRYMAMVGTRPGHLFEHLDMTEKPLGKYGETAPGTGPGSGPRRSQPDSRSERYLAVSRNIYRDPPDGQVLKYGAK